MYLYTVHPYVCGYRYLKTTNRTRVAVYLGITLIQAHLTFCFYVCTRTHHVCRPPFLHSLHTVHVTPLVRCSTFYTSTNSTLCPEVCSTQRAKFYPPTISPKHPHIFDYLWFEQCRAWGRQMYCTV